MIYLIQLMKMLNTEQIELFIGLFDDLSEEIDELGYDPIDLVDDLLKNHLGIIIEDGQQLSMLTDCIIKHHGRMRQQVNGACLYIGKEIA